VKLLLVHGGEGIAWLEMGSRVPQSSRGRSHLRPTAKA